MQVEVDPARAVSALQVFGDPAAPQLADLGDGCLRLASEGTPGQSSLRVTVTAPELLVLSLNDGAIVDLSLCALARTRVVVGGRARVSVCGGARLQVRVQDDGQALLEPAPDAEVELRLRDRSVVHLQGTAAALHVDAGDTCELSATYPSFVAATGHLFIAQRARAKLCVSDAVHGTVAPDAELLLARP